MVSRKILNYLWSSFLVLCSFSLIESKSEHDELATESHHRQKRFIYFNTQTPVDIGFIITIPLSFALPTFNLKTSRRFRRNANHDNFKFNMTTDDILPKDSYDDAAYIQELNKITSYFNTLEIEEDVCQQRIICEIFTDPHSYRPLSDLFMKKLTVDRGTVQEKKANRYFRYVQAMQDGIVSGDRDKCQDLYSRCPYSCEQRLHTEAMKFWTFLTSKLHLEFHDE